MGTQQQQQTQFKQDEDMLGQRLAKAEDTNAQLQGELSVVTDKMKLTQTELSRAQRSGQEDQGRRREATRRSSKQRDRPARDEGQR